jgi:hypothetical protein
MNYGIEHRDGTDHRYDSEQCDGIELRGGTEPRGRRRGGQPGNTNPLKHGFYSQHFKSAEAREVEGLQQAGLQEEVAMLRVMIRRVVELASNPETAAPDNASEQNSASDLESALTALKTLGVAASHLANLLRTEKILADQNGEVSRTLHQALGDIVAELRGSNS